MFTYGGDRVIKIDRDTYDPFVGQPYVAGRVGPKRYSSIHGLLPLYDNGRPTFLRIHPLSNVGGVRLARFSLNSGSGMHVLWEDSSTYDDYDKIEDLPVLISGQVMRIPYVKDTVIGFSTLYFTTGPTMFEILDEPSIVGESGLMVIGQPSALTDLNLMCIEHEVASSSYEADVETGVQGAAFGIDLRQYGPHAGDSDLKNFFWHVSGALGVVVYGHGYVLQWDAAGPTAVEEAVYAQAYTASTVAVAGTQQYSLGNGWPVVGWATKCSGGSTACTVKMGPFQTYT